MDPGINPRGPFQTELPTCKLDISNPQIPRQDPQKFSKHATQQPRLPEAFSGAYLPRNKLGIVRHRVTNASHCTSRNVANMPHFSVAVTTLSDDRHGVWSPDPGASVIGSQ